MLDFVFYLISSFLFLLLLYKKYLRVKKNLSLEEFFFLILLKIIFLIFILILNLIYLNISFFIQIVNHKYTLQKI